MKTESQIIREWNTCQFLAKELGVTVRDNSNSFVIEGKPGKGNFHTFATADNISEVIGFLRGASDFKSKMKEK